MYPIMNTAQRRTLVLRLLNAANDWLHYGGFPYRNDQARMLLDLASLVRRGEPIPHWYVYTWNGLPTRWLMLVDYRARRTLRRMADAYSVVECTCESITITA